MCEARGHQEIGICIGNHGVVPRDYLCTLAPRPLPAPPRPRLIAIARMCSEFLPSRRTLPSSLAGAVLTGNS